MTTFLSSAGSEAAAQSFEEISYETEDGATIVANVYGNGEHAVLLAHGMVFDKESWHAQAAALAEAGYRVLAIDFRGYGNSTSGSQGRALHLDVLGGIRYLRETGALRVSVIGGSMGGGAAGEAAVTAGSDEIDKLVLLAAVPVADPERLQGDKLFIVSEGDSFHDAVQQQYRRAPDPKRLVVLQGSAHAQHIFRSRERGTELMTTILEFLAD
ncbi:MAG TPA: alpha/beta fold hydrolase [Gammaproteobacteria bacterium]